ncbi:hypothetical protein GCM10010307_59240 [Streptomyces vastus]|uniref:Uncharacterized protein n=1 Tax=Streptomyces vastus TaxID=285451 RepID=A0ABN3RDR1_9ACTN
MPTAVLVVRAAPRGRPVDRSRATGRWRRLAAPGGREARAAPTVSGALVGSVGREVWASMVLPADRVLLAGLADPALRSVAPEARVAPVP